jgi:transcriptional regulator with XRE-family HTH domain
MSAGPNYFMPKPIYADLFKDKLNQHRADNNLSYQQLSKQIGFSTRHVIRWLKGTSYPAEKNLKQVCLRLCWPFDQFSIEARLDAKALANFLSLEAIQARYLRSCARDNSIEAYHMVGLAAWHIFNMLQVKNIVCILTADSVQSGTAYITCAVAPNLGVVIKVVGEKEGIKAEVSNGADAVFVGLKLVTDQTAPEFTVTIPKLVAYYGTHES